MENSLYLMLLAFTFAMTILSFIYSRQIVIRMFSAMLLVSSSIVGLQAFMYVGFGSNNVITYISSQAGDPGRSGEQEVLWLYGLMGVVQLMYSFWLMLKWSDDVVRTKGKASEEEESKYTFGGDD